MNDKTGVLDSYHLGEVLKASARKLGERCGADAVKMLATRLTEYIGLAEDDKYSYIWRSAIEDHEQDSHKEDTRAVLVDAVRDAALGITSASSPAALAVAKFLLESPYPTLVRVGIYVCGEHYGTVGPVFWECAKADWFIEVPYWHELYWFINKAFPRFSAAQRAHFLEFVERTKGDWSGESRQEEWDESHKRDLLHPAFGQGDSEVDEKYQKLVQRWGAERDHPDFHSYSSSGWSGERSPVASDALVGMSGEELVVFLRNFVPDSRSWDGPTYRGLASSISAAVRASEDGFGGRIDLFFDLARPYQHGLLRGLKERWSDDKRDIDWPAALRLAHAIASSPSFEPDLNGGRPEGWEPSVHWVVGDIADLLKSASGTERHMPPELQTSCLQVLRLVLGATTPNEAGQSNDAVSHAINSPRGKTLEAFIHLALAMRRAEVAETPGSNDTWAAVGPVFDAELATSESGLNADFAALAGMYCVNLHFLNSQWTEANFDRLLSTANDSAWRCAAQGFSYQNRLYDWLFKRLVSGGHLRKMIFSEGLPDQVSERALQFLGLAYLEGMETLDGESLLAELIVELKVEELSQLCWFFWTLRGQEPSPRAPKVLAFWLKVAAMIRVSRVSVPVLQSALSKLAVFIQEFSPATVEALVEAAPYAQHRHHGYMLVENLTRLAPQHPKEVATIFRAAVSGFLPDYRKEDVIACVNRLAEAGEIDEAEWICNAYAERGSMLLKDTYEALRAKQRAPSENEQHDK